MGVRVRPETSGAEQPSPARETGRLRLGLPLPSVRFLFFCFLNAVAFRVGRSLHTTQSLGIRCLCLGDSEGPGWTEEAGDRSGGRPRGALWGQPTRTWARRLHGDRKTKRGLGTPAPNPGGDASSPRPPARPAGSGGWRWQGGRAAEARARGGAGWGPGPERGSAAAGGEGGARPRGVRMLRSGWRARWGRGGGRGGRLLAAFIRGRRGEAPTGAVSCRSGCQQRPRRGAGRPPWLGAPPGGARGRGR